MATFSSVDRRRNNGNSSLISSSGIGLKLDQSLRACSSRNDSSVKPSSTARTRQRKRTSDDEKRGMSSIVSSRCPSLLLTPRTPSPTANHHMVYLIRHGESQGQVAPKASRLNDPALIDCGLTELGREQSKQMASRFNLPTMDLVLCSPLTRALQTALLAFPSATISVHYDLRELGKKDIPENTPRPWNQVLPQIIMSDGGGSTSMIDIQSLRPNFPWPQHHDRMPTVLRRQAIPKVFQWLARHLNATSPDGRSQHVAVVCHCHVIRAAFTDNRGFCPNQLKPDNAVPIRCMLTPQGDLRAL